MKLSIVICSLPYRYGKLEKLLESLVPQITREVELLIFSSYETQGEKLNKALEIAKGEYFCIVDDDDYVTRTFVEGIVRLANDVDMVGYDIYSDFSDLNEHTDGRKPYRFIHHTFKKSLLKKFPETVGVWDPDYVYSLDIKTWAWIPEQIYIYQFDKTDSAQMGNTR